MKTTAKTFYVLASTIRHRRRNHLLKVGVGRPAYLTKDEKAFVSMLQLLPDYGFKASKDIALQLENHYCQSLELEHHPMINGFDYLCKSILMISNGSENKSWNTHVLQLLQNNLVQDGYYSSKMLCRTTSCLKSLNKYLTWMKQVLVIKLKVIKFEV